MGYETKFTGEMLFTSNATSEVLAKLSSILGEDVREHLDWEDVHDLIFIDLMLNDKYTGIEWVAGTEKCYDMVGQLNLIIDLMNKDFPEFGLSGEMLAQGEEVADRYYIRCDDGPAYKDLEGSVCRNMIKGTCALIERNKEQCEAIGAQMTEMVRLNSLRRDSTNVLKQILFTDHGQIGMSARRKAVKLLERLKGETI